MLGTKANIAVKMIMILTPNYVRIYKPLNQDRDR
uniref:Uncharacterized protein n=1 Tax=Rhizophora mucronata TaxID=61149 RepID=A0A2P2QGN7_RHIMU